MDPATHTKEPSSPFRTPRVAVAVQYFNVLSLTAKIRRALGRNIMYSIPRNERHRRPGPRQACKKAECAQSYNHMRPDSSFCRRGNDLGREREGGMS